MTLIDNPTRSKIKKIHFIGIGGSGMSGIAEVLTNLGYEISGSDIQSNTATEKLEKLGCSISYKHQVENVIGKQAVVVSSAITKNNPELQEARQQKLLIVPRAEMLAELMRFRFGIAISGTHGKTTTSSILGHIMQPYNATSFLGGISENYHSNLILGGDEISVVEADEFDRSFLTLHPDIAIVTSMDADHLDIYGDKNHIEESFRLYASQVKRGGKLIFKYNLPIQKEGITYGVNSTSADYTAHNIRIQNGKYIFDFKNGAVEYKDMCLGLAGLHNVENATAAIIVGMLLQIPEEKIRAALASFAGVKRRFEYIVQNEKMVYIDDYAHHPEELRACINSVRQMYPGKKLTVIFQPHLFSRTKDFAQEFSEVLSLADQLIVMDIYPARELPMEGVDANLILNQVSIANKQAASKENLMEKLAIMDIELLLTVGAGDIDTMVKPIQELVG